MYIGYRYYDTAEKEVQFPFGYGLSYTTFEYSDLELSSSNIKDTDDLTVTFKIKNTGDVDGAEIAEIYVADQESTIFRPKKELRAFKKVFLKAGEEKEVSVTLSKRAFAFYNVELQDWQDVYKRQVQLGARHCGVKERIGELQVLQFFFGLCQIGTLTQ